MQDDGGQRFRYDAEPSKDSESLETRGRLEDAHRRLPERLRAPRQGVALPQAPASLLDGYVQISSSILTFILQ